MRVRIYATLRELVGSSAIDLQIPEATDVRRVLQRAGAEYPKLGRKLWDGNGQLNRSIQVLVNGRSIQFMSGLETPVQPGDKVDLFPPVGGG